MTQIRHSLLARYSAAVLIAVVAVLVRESFTPLWQMKVPFLTLFPAVLFSLGALA